MQAIIAPILFTFLIFYSATLCSAESLTPHQTSASCDPVDRRVTSTPVPPQTGVFLRRHLQLKDAVGGGSTAKTLLIGDSLAQMWPETDGWLNLGVGSDRIQNTLWRLSDMDVRKLKPTRIIMLIGTNNLSNQDPSCSIVSGISLLINRIHSDWPAAQLVLFDIIPRGEHLDAFDAERMQVNTLLDSVPASRTFVKTVKADEALLCDHSNRCSYYQPDMLHLTAIGYNALRELVDRTAGK